MTKGSAAARSDVNKYCTGGASSSSGCSHTSSEHRILRSARSSCLNRHLTAAAATLRFLWSAFTSEQWPFCQFLVPEPRSNQVPANSTSHAVLTPRAAMAAAGNGVPTSITQPWRPDLLVTSPMLLGPEDLWGTVPAPTKET